MALLLMAFAIYFNWGWFWALFISLGLVHIIRSEEIHFVEAVKRKETPKLFWIMVAIWSILALYSINSYMQILI